MSVEIGFARNDRIDAEAIGEIDRSSFAQGTVNVPAELERTWSRMWVARPLPDPRPCAFLLAWHVADELHVLSVATLASCRRQGIGGALLEHAIAFARDHRVESILLEVRRSNAGAIRLYRRFGFSAVGVRASYYADNAEDAVEMQLVLDPATGAVVPRVDEVNI